MNLKKSGLMGFLTSLAVIGSSIVGLGVGAASAASSPITVTFESDDASGASLGGSADFGGNASSVVTSTVGANTSKVGKIVNGGECWSGTTFLIKSSGWQLISDASKIISADVYSTVAISNVKMKVEGGAGDPAREVDVAHGGTGWERLTWDLGTGAPFAPGNYLKASIFVGFSCGTSSVHPAETYFDNISFPGATSPDVVIPRTTPQVLANFETSDSSGYAFVGFGGSSGSVDAAAPAGGSVGSAKAFKITEGGDCWAGTTFLKRGAKESLLSADNKVVKANIYSPASGKVIKLKLENASNGAQNKEVDVTSVAGWKTYSFDFTGFNADVDYNMASLFVNFTCGSGTKTSDAWYVDDVAFNGAVGANLEAAVTPVLVNFESNDASGYALTPFGGNAASVSSSAPAGGSTGSASALSITNSGECWTGVTFLSSSASLLGSGKTTVTANIYAPAAGKVIKLKLEDSANGDINKEVDVTSVQGWKTYSFDFSSFNSSLKYNKASIFVDFTCGGGTKDGSTWFVDDLAFLGAAGAALSGNSGGGSEPTPFNGNAVIRLAGLDASTAFNRQADADFFVGQGWYRGGLRVFTKQVEVAKTHRLTYVVSNAADGQPLANVKVKFVFGKEYSGSTAKVNVGAVSSTGNQQIVEGVTAADGTVSFDITNTNVAADGADNPGNNTAGNYTGNHLYSQVTAWVSNQNQDSIDLVDLVFYKPAGAPVIKTIVSRVTGINETNAYVGTCEGWCQYYAAGLRYFERGVQVGTTTTLNWTITDTDGAPYANKNVYLLLGKTYSGSNAKVSVNGTAFPGSGDEKRITLTTDANGLLSFDVANSNFNADADPYQASNLQNPRNGSKHLFVQIAVVGEKGNQDVLDIIDLNYYQPQDAGPATTYNVRLADWNASNSFDGTHVWGDGGIGSWFPANTGYFAKYVAAGSTFNLRYKVTNAATGALAPNGTVVTLQLGTAWSGSNAKFTVNNVNVDGLTKWGANGQLDQASTTAVVSNGYITVPVTALDPAIDATTNPGNAKANPDSLNPLFMQVKVKVEGNAITQQDWVNIIATKPLESAPVISSISATSGKKGQAIDIVGTNLGDALGTTVSLFTAAASGKPAVTTPVTVLSVNADGTRLTVSSPAIAQKGYFRVTNSGGTATGNSAFTASTTTTAKPTITLTSSLVKEVGSTFTLNGTNLASSTIAIGGVSAPVTILTANSVVVTVPENVVSGSTISATNLGGTTTTSKFVYQAAVVSDFTKAARVGQNVTFTGKNLKATSVVFGGNKTGKIVSSSATSLTVTVPTGALSGVIKVTTGAGSVFTTESFTVTPPAPTVSSFTPTTAKKGVSLVTVRGTNLTGATVTLGSVQVTLAAGANSTSFKFIVPSSAVTGKITVTTPGGTVISSGTLVVTN